MGELLENIENLEDGYVIPEHVLIESVKSVGEGGISKTLEEGARLKGIGYDPIYVYFPEKNMLYATYQAIIN